MSADRAQEIMCFLKVPGSIIKRCDNAVLLWLMDTVFCCAEDVGNEGELKYLKERDLEVFFSCDLPPLPVGLRLTVLKQAIWSKLEAMYHTEQAAAAGSGAGGPAAVSAVGMVIKNTTERSRDDKKNANSTVFWGEFVTWGTASQGEITDVFKTPEQARNFLRQVNNSINCD
jgi:hypothetical protein